MPWWNPFKRLPEQPEGGSAAPRASKAGDFDQRLLKDRIILLGTPINDDVATRVVAQLLFLESESPTQGVHLYLNSPGGSVTAAFAICDTMEFVKPDVSTLCVGQCSGMAALLFALGKAGRRFALPNSYFQLMPFSGGEHPEARAAIARLRQDFARRMAGATGQTEDQVLADCEANLHLSATDAIRYGLVDEIVERSQLRPT
ncbi:MAG TPA: ATP-dependent Clp protease proteolytic subunit [Myxococcus sp.]|nr:ATP-dependent Clp protease proteolytic subunit [Myxococcus sp.]